MMDTQTEKIYSPTPTLSDGSSGAGSLGGTLRRWIRAARAAVGPFSRVPQVPQRCPLEVATVCEAVIRVGGAGHVSTAALALRGPGGTEHVLLFRGYSPDGNRERAAAYARLNAFEYLAGRPTGAAITRLHVDDARARDAIGALLDSFPTLTLAGVPDAALSTAAARAAVRANAGPVSAARPTERVPGGSTHTVVATDASIVPGIPGAGIAAVAGDGRLWQETLPATGDITWAELNAIHLALARTATTERVVVLSDSKAAVAFANGTAVPAQSRMVRLAAQIQSLCTGRDVSIQWVRSHRGHALNEAADQAARIARRSLTASPAAA